MDPIDEFKASGPGTRVVWSGESTVYYQQGTVPPVSVNVAFGYDRLEEWYEVATGQRTGHIYSRNTNPVTELLEEKMRCLDGAEAGCSFSTGMAAISNTLNAFLVPGMRVVSQKDTYGGTSSLFLHFLPQRGITIHLHETTDTDGMESAIREGCDLVYLETPTNPTLKIVDIRRMTRAAHEVGAIVVVDNTFATPINQLPIALGADLVVYSATKFLGGHADALGGILTGRSDLVKKVFHYREIHGASMDPFAAFLILRGLKTLELRMLRHNDNARQIAEYLFHHPKIEQVNYPGLPQHPQHEIAQSQMNGYGGVLSFAPKGDYRNVTALLESLRLVRLAAHLGSVDTIAGPPRTTSHVENTAEESVQLGISENLIRYSAGIENACDLIRDLEAGLSHL